MTYSDIIIFRINNLTKERNLNTNSLANLCGIAQSTLDNIMRGKTKNPKLITLHRLSTGLGITLSEFFDFPEMNETIFDDE